MAADKEELDDLSELFFGQATNGKFHQTSFDGFIDISGRLLATKLVLRSLHFLGPFTADTLSCPSLLFEDCTFEQGLELRNGRIEGDLAFERCTFSADPQAPERGRIGSVDLRGTRVDGSIKIQHCTIGQDCRLDRIVVRGNVRIRRDTSVSGTTSFAGASIDSQLDLSGGAFGEIVFNGSSLGALWIGSRDPVTCSGLYATDSDVRTYARLTRLHARCGRGAGAASKRLHLEEEGTIAFRGCRFGSLFSTWIVKRYGEEEDGWQDDNRVIAEKAFLFTDCKVKGELTLSRLRVGRGDPARALDGAGRAITTKGGADNKPWGHVRLDRTEVDGALLILSPISVAHRFELSVGAREKARKKIRPDPMEPQFRAHMRSLSMRDFKASYVDLTGLSLHACGRDDRDGPIDGCLVGDRMEIKSSLTTYAWFWNKDRTQKLRAFTEISGAMRLRGARIGELRLASESFGVAEDCRAHTDGVVLELASIGELRVPPRPAQADKHHANDFPVPLDLSGMTVRHWNFEEDVTAEGTAEVDHYLDFLDNDEKLHRDVYRSVAKSLRDVGRDDDAEKVLYTEEYRARWEHHRLEASRRAAAKAAAKETEFSEASTGAKATVQPSPAAKKRPDWPPYRNAGRRKTPWLRRFRLALPPFLRDRHPFEEIDRWVLQYRRNPIRVLYLILALFAFSAAFVGSHASNFELSDNARLVLEHRAGANEDFARGIDHWVEGDNVGPEAGRWQLGDALWMTARYHVPIVPMAFRDEYAASNDSPLAIGAGWKWKLTFATAEDWFVLMALFNWIMWPLLLTFALRRALRAE
jgi:hypothetical protein